LISFFVLVLDVNWYKTHQIQNRLDSMNAILQSVYACKYGLQKKFLYMKETVA
jgi:hypothetical protein